MLLLALALLTSTAIGYLVAGAALPVYKPAWADGLLKSSLAIGLGIGITSCFFFLERVLIGPSLPLSFTTEFVLLTAAVFVFWFTRNGRQQVAAIQANPHGLLWWLLPPLLVALALSSALFVNSTASNPYGAWDAFAIWNQRALFFAQPDDTWRRAFSPLLNEAAGAGATHADYPMLLSGYVARCWSWSASLGNVAAPIAVAALFSAATVGVLISALAILRAWSLGVLAGLILLGTAFLQNGPWQYADVPLGYFYLTGFALLLIADAHAEPAFCLSGLAVGFAAWTKNEGLLFAVLAGLAVAAYALKTKNWKALALFTAGAALPIAIALYFRVSLAPPTGTYAQLSLGDAAQKIVSGSRYLKIVQSLWRDALLQGAGIANPFITVALLLGLLKFASTRLRRPMTIASLGALAALSLGYLGVYVITPLDLTWHINTSLNRLFMHFWPSFIFLTLSICGAPEESAIQEQPTAGRVKKKHRIRSVARS